MADGERSAKQYAEEKGGKEMKVIRWRPGGCRDGAITYLSEKPASDLTIIRGDQMPRVEHEIVPVMVSERKQKGDVRDVAKALDRNQFRAIS